MHLEVKKESQERNSKTTLLLGKENVLSAAFANLYAMSDTKFPYKICRSILSVDILQCQI